MVNIKMAGTSFRFMRHDNFYLPRLRLNLMALPRSRIGAICAPPSGIWRRCSKSRVRKSLLRHRDEILLSVQPGNLVSKQAKASSRETTPRLDPHTAASLAPAIASQAASISLSSSRLATRRSARRYRSAGPSFNASASSLSTVVIRSSPAF